MGHQTYITRVFFFFHSYLHIHPSALQTPEPVTHCWTHHSVRALPHCILGRLICFAGFPFPPPSQASPLPFLQSMDKYLNQAEEVCLSIDSPVLCGQHKSWGQAELVYLPGYSATATTTTITMATTCSAGPGFYCYCPAMATRFRGPSHALAVFSAKPC